ncbi:MAG: selenide, water dikinase SelD [Hyphomicrobiaceae bacterium]
MHVSPVRKRLVLIGGGHAHVFVLRALAMRPEPGLGVTLIAKELDAPYSGMLPGHVAGHYSLDDCHIDLVRLAQRAGVRLIHGEAVGIDRGARRILLHDRPPVGYDVVSFDTGITPSLGDIRGAEKYAIAVKPVSLFAPKWQALLSRALQVDGPRRIAVVGTGAAGFELVLALRHRLLDEAKSRGLAPEAFTFTLIGSGGVLPTHNVRAQRLGRKALAERHITVIESDSAVEITAEHIVLTSGNRVPADAVLVTTKAAPPAWFATAGLPLDPRGFIAVRPTLQVLDDDDVFAVGDCATVTEHVREKAGVFAVRQGPPLTDNLRRRVNGQAAQPFRPQRQFLTLLSLGDKQAIAARGTFAATGRWAWTWKDRIDRAFMDRFNKLPAMASRDGDETADNEMRCGGCAAKIGPVTLARALLRLPAASDTAAIVDLAPGDDAALLDLGAKDLRLESVDFFRAIWPEPFVMGEIAAAHALSDIFAKGGRPDHALAVAVLPHADAKPSEDDLFQLMAGARAVFDREQVALVGGHSSEGAELSVGFFVSGAVPRQRVLRKGGLAVGDHLILTKPLGTGILFAAWMRGRAHARDVAAAIASMRATNGVASRVLANHAATAATDITGFGLAGHLIEMLEGSGRAAAITIDRLPLLSGVAELAATGIGSTLLPENLALADKVGSAGLEARTLAILFDPQTSGGLLAGIPAARAQACLAALAAAGIAAADIGVVTERAAGAGHLIDVATSLAPLSKPELVA